ncbi:MAG: hypothetical protein SangKO_051990 [Sandaracinaceae bacterium]
MHRLLPLALLALPACALEAGGLQTAPSAHHPPPPEDAAVAPRTSRSWPADAAFRAARESLPRPWSMVEVGGGDAGRHALVGREDDEWQLIVWFTSEGFEPPPEGCERFPCAWPEGLVTEPPVGASPPLPDELAEHVAYAHTLLAFEGELNVYDEDELVDAIDLPEGAWAGPSGVDLVPHLEALRRYHPRGYCSMDTTPQTVAQIRAHAAAQAGRTGWAVQGWMDTVGYWSSPRTAWSSYGQAHPQGHLGLLREVGVDPQQLMLGLLIDLPGDRRRLALADRRRVVPDLGPDFVARVRRWIDDDRLDPYNRALLLATVSELPFTDDPSYGRLPPGARALLEAWSR